VIPMLSAQILTWLSSRLGRRISLILVSAVAVWYAIPAFLIAYTEGFQSTIVINAHALRGHDVRFADILYPFNGRFFLLTRLGTSLSILGLQRVAPLSGLDAFRVLGIVSLVLLLAVLLMFLWRVRGVSPTLGLLCCLFFPPIFESAYLPNDDMPSAVLVCLAVLLFWTSPTLARSAITGLLLGFAALLRLDAVLVMPAFVVLLFTEVHGWKARVARACCGGVFVAAVPIITYRLSGLSFFDSFAAANRGIRLWDRPTNPLHTDAHTLLLNVTLVGLVACALGVVSFVRAKNWRDVTLSVVIPLVYIIAYRSQLFEGRYLLPLSPFVLMSMAEGFKSVSSLSARAKSGAVAALAVGIAVWIAPPPRALPRALIADPDGPRLIIGRAWNPLPTLWWQARLHAGQAAIESEIERAAALHDPVIVTGFWNADRLVTLMLLEHGFIEIPDRTPKACRKVAETFVRGSARIVQIRAHVPFLRHHSELLTWEHDGVSCLHAMDMRIARLPFIGAGTLDSPAVKLLGPGVLFSSASDSPPPFASRLVSALGGISVAELSAAGVSSALREPPLTPEDRRAIENALAQRANLLR